jgi:GT2 family glycosyltransferase
MTTRPAISVVTVSMNRTEHLKKSAAAISQSPHHSEHLILDFGSSKPITSADLPKDHRIRLIRVDAPGGRWWLSQAYNLAFSLAECDSILKVDADVLISVRRFRKINVPRD